MSIDILLYHFNDVMHLLWPGGVTGTVSVAVIVFEMTKQIDCAVPVLISVLTARAVASLFVESLYDTMLRLGRLPALPPTQSTDRQLRQVRCAKKPLAALAPALAPVVFSWLLYPIGCTCVHMCKTWHTGE